MGKKRRKHNKKAEKPATQSARKSSRKKLIWAGVLFLGALALIYNTTDWLDGIFRNSHRPTHPVMIERSRLRPIHSTDLPANYPKSEFSDFAGAEACQSCHAQEYAAWKTSAHGKAGGDPDKVEIIAKFDGKPLRFKDALVTPKRQSDGKYVFVVSQDGQPERIITVDAVVGGGHMVGGGTQSFFTRLPDGTLRFLPFDFIRKENIWFVQLRENEHWVPITREIALDDLAQWYPHRMLGNIAGTSNCQNCHGSQILLTYNPAERQYKTQFTTLQINCESCHGPGKRHIEIVQTADLAKTADIGMDALATYSKDASLDVCFQCHAVKDVLRDDYLPGDDLAEFYSMKLPLLATEPYLADGRVRSFAYQQNHLFSDCYINGSMTCVDCHSPHSQEYRDVTGKALVGRFDDGQCTGCHASKARAPETHTFHKPGSEGSLCTSCHMPFLQHQGLGDDLTFARSDHVIPIPRPAFDASIGIENACIKCHQDKTVAWLQQKVDNWYGESKPHNPMTAAIFAAENVYDITAAAKLLLRPDIHHPIGQVSGLATFIKRFLRPDMRDLGKSTVARLVRLSESDDIDLKALSLMALHLSMDYDPEIHEYIAKSLKGTGARENALRLRWALAIDYLGSVYASNDDNTNAIKAYRKALEINPSDDYTWRNLGRSYRQVSDYSNAIGAYLQASKINPYEIDTYFQLAEIYNRTGDRDGFIAALQNVLKYDPTNQRAQEILRQVTQ